MPVYNKQTAHGLLVLKETTGQRTEDIRVPIKEILRAGLFGVNISKEEQDGLERKYETIAVVLTKSAMERLEFLRGASKTTELNMLHSVSRGFHSLYGEYNEDADLVSFINKGEFNCHVSTTVMADVITRQGQQVRIIELQHHVMLAMDNYALETLFRSEDRAIFPREEIERKYSKRREGDMGLLLAMAWYNKGVELNTHSDKNKAIEAYERALSIDPNLIGAWCNIGAVLYAKGIVGKALESYEKALKINPNYVSALYGKGTVLNAIGLRKEAREIIAKAEEIEMNEEITKRRRA